MPLRPLRGLALRDSLRPPDGGLWRSIALEPGQTLLLMLGLGILLGVEWNELHFLERHGVAGFFGRWALAGASVGAVGFGIGRVAEAWPWWGFFGALGIGAVLGNAVGLECGRLLGRASDVW